MKSRFKFFILGLLALTVSSAGAQNFFDTSAPDKFINFGVRLGINTSNQTSPSYGKISNLDSWGTGFDAGAVVDINFRDFLSVQPGFFFESRSHNYSYISEALTGGSIPDVANYGHTRSTWFKIPLLASVKFNPASNLRWALEAGPVFGFGLGGSDKSHFFSPDYGWTRFKTGYFDNRKKWSFGWKLGTTLRYAGHYLLGIHYEAGTSDVYKSDIVGGRHKAWVFTLGYDF